MLSVPATEPVSKRRVLIHAQVLVDRTLNVMWSVTSRFADVPVGSLVIRSVSVASKYAQQHSALQKLSTPVSLARAEPMLTVAPDNVQVRAPVCPAILVTHI